LIYYRDASFEEIVAAATAEGQPSLANWYNSEQAGLQPYRDAVRGGEAAKKFLARKPDEDALLFKLREDAFQNINVCEIIVDEQSHFAYGQPPTRKVMLFGAEDPTDERNEVIDRQFGEVYENNCAYSFYREQMATAAIADRWTWQKIWYGLDKSIRFSRIKRECVYPVRDPADPARSLLGVVEIRKRGTADFEYLLWSTTEVKRITGGWKLISEEVHPLKAHKMIPFVPYGDITLDGRHALGNAFYDQIVLINMRSWELAGWRAQAFAILVAIGEMIDEESPSEVDGVKRVKVGMDRFLQMEKGGQFSAVNPNFPIQQVREAQSDLLRESLERSKVSSTAVDSSGTPEQPWSLIMRHLRPLQDRMLNIARFKASEMLTMRTVAATANAVGMLPIVPDGLVYSVTFPEDILPMNKKEQRDMDATDVEADRVLLEDYVEKWIKAGARKEEVSAYVEALDKQRMTRQQGVVDILGGGRKSPFGLPPPATSKAGELYPEDKIPAPVEA